MLTKYPWIGRGEGRDPVTKNYTELHCPANRWTKNWLRGLKLIIWQYFKPEQIELQKYYSWALSDENMALGLGSDPHLAEHLFQWAWALQNTVR